MSNDKYKINGQDSHPKRVPIHKQKMMSAVKKVGFVPRIVNEEPGRVEAFKKAGWAIVTEKDRNNSDPRIQNGTSIDSAVRYVVNKDPGAKSHTAVLMEIPEEHYDADFLDQQNEIEEKERQLDPKNSKQQGADYGNMSMGSITKK